MVFFLNYELVLKVPTVTGLKIPLPLALFGLVHITHTLTNRTNKAYQNRMAPDCLAYFRERLAACEAQLEQLQARDRNSREARTVHSEAVGVK